MVSSSVASLLWALLAITLTILTAILAWYLYKRVFKPRLLARSILRARQAHQQYNDQCDTLFADDPFLAEQYIQMKRARPETEVLNLCTNQAKHVLGRK
jgi:hypothetical protein